MSKLARLSRRVGMGSQWHPLESRQMFCAAHLAGQDFGDDVGTFPAITDTSDVASVAPASASVAAGVPLEDVPALDSRPGAAAKLFLDFDGDVTPVWVNDTPGATPAYDQDGDATTFSPGEVESIRDIWARVSEKYSPFNIDVTTVDPGNLTNRLTLKVVIGGDGAWLGSQAGGVSYVGSFSNSLINTAFVFPKMLANGFSKYVAEATAHEAGHAFGLQHQGVWNGTTLAEEYNPGTAAAAPIMGDSYDATRGLWWRGAPSTSPSSIQDDMAVIAGTANGFGYAADDVGNTASAAKVATVSGTVLSGSGLIERTTDVDTFSFSTAAGTVSLAAGVASAGPTLDLELELRDAAGTIVAAADTASLGESISASVPAGTYYLNVKSHGGYGDVGQYTVSGTVVEAPVAPAVPAPIDRLVATSVSRSEIRLDWPAPLEDVSGFNVYRSTDGVTWLRLATLGPTATGYDDLRLRRLTMYHYKVNAFNATGEAADGNVASVRTGSGAAVSSLPKTSTVFSSTPVAAPVGDAISRALVAAVARRELLA